MKIKKLNYNPILYEKWKSRDLQADWYCKYKNRLFDKDDLRIALTQSKNHFGEWYTAIQYGKRGYKTLVEKYKFGKTHKEKFRTLKKYLKADKLNFLITARHQPPDLFVYKGKKFFFAEVKKDKDRLSGAQKDFFKKIEHKLNCKVYLIELKMAA